MSSQDKIKNSKKPKLENLDTLIKARFNKADPSESSLHNGSTLPKFLRVFSQSRVSRLNPENKVNGYQLKSFSTKRLINQLTNQLDQIKETLKQSLISLSHHQKKKLSKRKQKAIAEISEPESKSRQNKNFNDILEDIGERKARYKMLRKQPMEQKNRPSSEERTLFYGVDCIDNTEFKIKITLSQTDYHLFAKNNHTRLMLEMCYSDYMKLHIGQLKGNPCNIFRYLEIKGKKLLLKLNNIAEKKEAPSLKSYLGYY